MFDIGWTELVVLGLVILIVLGPSEIPSVLRWIGRVTGQIRRLAADFQRNLEKMDMPPRQDVPGAIGVRSPTSSVKAKSPLSPTQDIKQAPRRTDGGAIDDDLGGDLFANMPTEASDKPVTEHSVSNSNGHPRGKSQ